LIIMVTLPLSYTGGVIALLVCDMPLSIVAVVGFILLTGIVVNNGIVFVDYANQMRATGLSRHEALVLTGKHRLRPILMTALTTIIAMITTALAVGESAEMSQPMAIVVIGGMVYATALTLIVVPIIYDLMGGKEGDGDAERTPDLEVPPSARYDDIVLD
ncbi:MAG: efflux RND transporter permease subunit, partial [Actinobacteria bacterium]|nr:efflux RND transporter permease subunit [Actinomycetota bacterium]